MTQVFSTDPFVQNLRTALQKLQPGRRLLVAFSGGPDSTALLYGLQACRAEGDLFDLQVCHVNHRLRGLESDADEEFCRQICARLQVPIHVERLAVPQAKDEASLREARYKALIDAALTNGCDSCLTGHTKDDQVETMLFRLFRGTAPGGLQGIPECRELAPGLFVFRPLLEFERSDCQAYLERLNISARQDSSNSETAYSRNYIRHEIIPVVEKRFPGFGQRLIQLRTLLAADEDFLLKEQVQRIHKTDGLEPDSSWLSAAELLCLPLTLRRRLLAQSLKAHDIEPSFQRLETLLEMLEEEKSAALSLSERWDLRLEQGKLYWLEKKANNQLNAESNFQFEIQKQGLTLIAPLNMMFGCKAISEDFCLPEHYPPKESWEIFADLSRIDTSLILRLRQPGDRISPLGMKTSVRLKQYLHTHKSLTTVKYQEQTVVLADEEEILWVPGCGISEKIAVRKRPSHRITFQQIAPDKVMLS
ncbi:MAG: tRNA lysidine(34) synthetase TilS [Candidatus Obscuribacterales bacterium]|nr:tRNA lysidine(34) synthetase TilS [Candidatus Obscuribacterales bacterium]